MEFEDLKSIVEDYKEALLEELEAKTVAAKAESEVARIKDVVISEAYADGVIDGKNAETRKAQEAAELQACLAYAEAQAQAEVASKHASRAEIDRKERDAYVSLVRAWLYSQSGIH